MAKHQDLLVTVVIIFQKISTRFEEHFSANVGGQRLERTQ